MNLRVDAIRIAALQRKELPKVRRFVGVPLNTGHPAYCNPRSAFIDVLKL